MNLLVLSGQLPRRNDDGSWGLHGLLRELAGHCRVSLFAFVEGDVDEESLEALTTAGVEVATMPRVDALGWGNLHHAIPPVVARQYGAKAMRAAVRAALRQGAFDLVQVEYFGMAHLVHGACDDLPVVYTCHEAQGLLHRRLLEDAAAGSVARMRRWLPWARALRHERRVLSRFDHIVTLSDVDERALRTVVPHVAITTIPTAIDTTHFAPTDPTRVEPMICFVGNYGHVPNIDAARWFTLEVFWRIRRRLPNVELHLLGRNPTPIVRALGQHPGVHVSGFLPDLRPHLSRASVVVAPIRLGAGLRGKILEAWAAGKALVMTSRAGEGFPVEDGQNALVRDDAESFASAVEQCLLDAPLRERLGCEGRKLVERRFSKDASPARRYLEVYAKVLARRGARHP